MGNLNVWNGTIFFLSTALDSLLYEYKWIIEQSDSTYKQWKADEAELYLRWQIDPCDIRAIWIRFHTSIVHRCEYDSELREMAYAGTVVMVGFLKRQIDQIIQHECKVYS